MSSPARAGGLGVAIATPALSFTTVELKVCERCGRSFLRSRSVGSPAIYCATCERNFVDVAAQQKLLERPRAIEAQKGETMNGTDKEKTPPAQAATLPERRICEVCSASLSFNNTSGRCKLHRARSHRKANGHAKSAAGTDIKVNGNGAAAAKPNGHGHNHLALEARVNLVLKALPLNEKVRMISSWLCLGEC